MLDYGTRPNSLTKMNKLLSYLRHPKNIGFALLYHSHGFLPDELCIRWQYRLFVGRKLNLKHPKRYTEKIQWLKLYYHNPIIPSLVDKITAKEYVSKLIGEEHIVKTYGVWNSFEEIDLNALPDRFVLKTNHTGGGEGIILCKDKSKLDIEKAKAILKRCLGLNMYNSTREWPYKTIKPQIVAEQLLETSDGSGIQDYKFYCFDGIPRVLLIASNRFSTHNYNYLSMDFCPLPIVSCCGEPIDASLLKKPDNFEEMKHIASVLSKGFPHVRVDLYDIENVVFFGELTFFDSSGYDNMSSDAVDVEWGKWITLPKKVR